MLPVNVRIARSEQLTPEIRIGTRLVGLKMLFTLRYSPDDQSYHRFYVLSLGLWFVNLDISWSKDTKGETCRKDIATSRNADSGMF